MSSEGSITHWIAEIKDGHSAGARGIWERYFPRLVELARKQIRGVPRGRADEEDVALSALDSFCRAAREGRFPDLADRDGLWRLLLQMTVHKAMGLARHERRQRRGEGRVQSLDDEKMVSDEGLVAEIVGREPTPEFAAMMADECRRLIQKLDDHRVRLRRPVAARSNDHLLDFDPYRTWIGASEAGMVVRALVVSAIVGGVVLAIFLLVRM